MNRLPWFTHDHAAHEGQFIKAAMDRFGHFGYAAYFIILELLHRHGVGDNLKISAAKLCASLRSRRPQVVSFLVFAATYGDPNPAPKSGWSSTEPRPNLDFSGTSGKVKFTWKSDEVELQINKFRERQSKLKSNLPSTFRQPSVNLPLEREGEREVRIQAGPKKKGPDLIPHGDYKAIRPDQKVILAYKIFRGIKEDDREWDRANYKTWIRAAQKLLGAFGGDHTKAIPWFETWAEEADIKGFDWNLATAAKHAWDTKGRRGDGEHALDGAKVDAGSKTDQRTGRYIAPHREVSRQGVARPRDTVSSPSGGEDGPILGPEDIGGTPGANPDKVDGGQEGLLGEGSRIDDEEAFG